MTLRIAGYAALFDRADGLRDTIRPGAFRRTLAERRAPFPLYWQHRPDQRIGWVENAGEDERGLRIVAQIDNPDGRAAKLLRERAVNAEPPLVPRGEERGAEEVLCWTDRIRADVLLAASRSASCAGRVRWRL